MRRGFALLGIVALSVVGFGPSLEASTALQEYHSSDGKTLSITMPGDRDEGRITVHFKKGGGYQVCLEVVNGEMRARWKRFNKEGSPVATGGDGLSYIC